MFINDFSTQTSKADSIAMRLCFDQCHCYGIILHLEFSYLIVEHGVLLVYAVSKEGKELDLGKIKVIVSLQPPSDINGMYKIFGYIGWYRHIMHDYANAINPLTNLTKKGVIYNWTFECQEGLYALKA
jgi:hypothetical protein